MNPSLRVAVGQVAPGVDAASNRAAIRRAIDDGVQQGARLVLLPEESMLTAGEIDEGRADIVAREWPAFLALLSDAARTHSVWIIAGGYEPSGTELPYNTIVVIGPEGEVVDSYRKLHLYDAFSYRESDYVTPGAEVPPVVMVDGVAVGIVNCYDIRFPELTRDLVGRGADVLAISAAWVGGTRKEDHWLTLMRARAIENTCWVLGAGTSSPDCIGSSLVIDPLGIVTQQMPPTGEHVLLADVTLDRIAEVRHAVPSLANRRLTTAVSVQEQS